MRGSPSTDSFAGAVRAVLTLAFLGLIVAWFLNLWAS
jgi:hypothetical protein